MEIERKYLVEKIPLELAEYPSHIIEQGYLCTEPVVRIRKQDDEFILTYKGKGLLAREEYNLPLTEEAYDHLKKKVDGVIISKKRYLIPLGDSLTIELDIFADPIAPLVLAEVEFTSIEEANSFIPPEWLGKDVTENAQYQNSAMSRREVCIKK